MELRLAVLELAPGASADDIKRSYRKLAVKHHPDKNQGDDASKARFQKISERVRDPLGGLMRKFYDETGELDDVPVSSEEFVSMFNDLMSELMDGDSILEMVEGMSEAELAEMPPFPFPKELFPKGTFPPGMRFTSEGLSNLPPSMLSALEDGVPPDLADMFERASRRWAAAAAGVGAAAAAPSRAARCASAAARRASASARGGRGRMGLDEEDEMAMMELVMEVMETGEMPPGMPPDVMEERAPTPRGRGYCRRG